MKYLEPYWGGDFEGKNQGEFWQSQEGLGYQTQGRGRLHYIRAVYLYAF